MVKTRKVKRRVSYSSAKCEYCGRRMSTGSTGGVRGTNDDVGTYWRNLRCKHCRGYGHYMTSRVRMFG